MDKSTFETAVDVSSPTQWHPPTDVVVIVLFAVVSDLILLATPLELAALRAVFALPLALFVPGYVLVAALYPRRYTGDGPDGSQLVSDRSNLSAAGVRRATRTRPINWKERAALSFGASLAVIPFLGLVTAPITGALSPRAVLMALNAFVLLGAVVAVRRRNALARNERFRVPVRRWATVVRESVVERERNLDGVLSALLLVSVLVAAGAFGFALVVPQSAEAYTSTALLTENADGELVASDYPEELAGDGDGSLVLQVKNHEGVATTYTVVVELQRVDTSGEAATVTAQREVARTRQTVDADGTWRASPPIAPAMTGEDLRLTYLVYRGDPPANPTTENAYRRLFLWVDVPEASS